MKELFTYNYDITDECTSGDITKLAELINTAKISDSAKKADIPSQLEMSKLAEDECALIIYHPSLGALNKYACSTKELVELNTLYLLEKAPKLPDELCKVAAHYLIEASKAFHLNPSEELIKLEDSCVKDNVVNISEINPVAYQIKLASRTKQNTNTFIGKLANNQFAVPSKRKYPLIDENTIKTAMAFFDAYSQDLPILDRLEFAYNTKLAAQNQSIKLTGKIAKYASLDPKSLNPDFTVQVKARKDLTVDSSAQNLYEELLTKKANLEPVKIAKVLSKLDEETGINQYWGRYIEEPLLATLGIIKEASVTVNGKTITKTALSQLCEKDLSKWVDNRTLDELKGNEGLQVLASLPMPTQDGLLTLLSN